MAPAKTPYLSIVAVSRNDNHGGDMHKRMRVFVRGLIHQCNKFRLPCELLLVEWNPPGGSAPLKTILPSVSEADYLAIRYIVVPPELHRRLAFNEQIPLFQMIGKNVGIRRAAAEYVLCTNVDLLFSDALFERLAQKNLQPGCFYRANRCDVPNTLNEEWQVEDQLKFCLRNTRQRLGKDYRWPNIANTTGVVFRYPFFYPFIKTYARLRQQFERSLEDQLNRLDLDACGDFTLMSKADWLRIQGYPELEMYSIHIDSMGIMAAAALGMEQVIFKGEECTYHLEHKAGWEFENPIEKLFFYTKKPMLDWWTARGAGLYIMEKQTTYNLNTSNWGFADEQLEER